MRSKFRMEEENQKSKSRYSAEEKQAFISQWKRSGLSRQAFCRQHKMSYYSFMNWMRKDRPARKEFSSTFIPLEIKSNNEQMFAQIEVRGKRIQLYQPVSAIFLKQILG